MRRVTADVPDWVATISHPLEDQLGIQVQRLSVDLAIATMPVAGNTQPAGMLHGGASCVLAEGLGSLACAAYGRERGLLPVGVDLNITHHRAVTSGQVTATARPLHLGSRTACYEIVIVNDHGERTATARLTCRLIPAPPGRG